MDQFDCARPNGGFPEVYRSSTTDRLWPVSDRRLKPNASLVASDHLQAFAGIRGMQAKENDVLSVWNHWGCAATWLLLVACVAGCSTLPNGRGWGQDATLAPGWARVGQAAVQAACDPKVWVPLAGAAVFQIDGWDQRWPHFFGHGYKWISVRA
jgi:hypothetical protein